MWVILVGGRDSGISISGSDYYDALAGAVKYVAKSLGVVDESLIDVISWKEAGL